MIIIISKIIPKENKETDFIRIASDLVDSSRNEENNISYDFVSSLDDNEFLFIEKWNNMDAFNEHINSNHFKLFNHLSNIFIEDMEIKVYDGEEVNLME